MASLVNKWDAIRQKELEEENADSDEEDPVKVQVCLTSIHSCTQLHPLLLQNYQITTFFCFVFMCLMVLR